MKDMLYRMAARLTDSANARHISEFTRVEIDTWMPSWLAVFVLAATAILVFGRYMREKNASPAARMALASMRFVAYAMLLLMLLRPVMKIEGEGSPPGKVPVVVDGSESMDIKDVDGKTRTSCASAVLSTMNSSGRNRAMLGLEFYRAGKSFARIEGDSLPPGDLDYSSINQMIGKAASASLGEYCPGIVLLGDGAHNTGEIPENAAADLRKAGIPLYACGIGKERSKDISIQYLLGEDIVFIDEKAKLFANVGQAGYSGRNVELEISLADEIVYSGVHTLEKDGENSITLEYVPKRKGLLQMKARIKPLEGETTEENNVHLKNLRVIDEQIRVLLLFGAPSWEMRYLAGAFERDKRVESKIFLQESDRRLFKAKDGGGVFLQALPKDINELNSSYDIVIMSRTNLATLPAGFAEALKGFVEEKGASLIVCADPSWNPHNFRGGPLEQLLPVGLGDRGPRGYQDELFDISKDRFSFELGEEGASHPLAAFSGDKDENARMWMELPGISWAYHAKRLKPSAICLVHLLSKNTGQRIPGIVFHSYGKGMVFFNSFDSTWRWRKEFGDRYFRDFWAKTVQFAGLPHLLEESARSAIFTASENCYAGEKITVRAKLSNPDFTPYTGDSAEMTVTESGVRRIVKLVPMRGKSGIYRGDYVPETPGSITLEMDAGFSASPIELRVSKKQKEFADSGMNRALLERLCTETGGRFYEYGAHDKIVEDIWKNRPKVPIQASVETWDSLALLLAALIVFSCEWLLRKLKHLD